MKKAIFSSALFLLLSFLVINPLKAKNNIPEFIAKANTAINIQPGNQFTIGKAYEIVNSDGKVFKKGVIRSNNAVFISLLELQAGIFNIKIDNNIVHSFKIKNP